MVTLITAIILVAFAGAASGATITIAPDQVVVGEFVTIEGAGFEANETVALSCHVHDFAIPVRDNNYNYSLEYLNLFEPNTNFSVCLREVEDDITVRIVMSSGSMTLNNISTSESMIYDYDAVNRTVTVSSRESLPTGIYELIAISGTASNNATEVYMDVTVIINVTTNATGYFKTVIDTQGIPEETYTISADGTEATLKITAPDITPPDSITNLTVTAVGATRVNWIWTNPANSDFNYTMVYVNGVWQANISEPLYIATGLTPTTEYEIATRTVDLVGNINDTWVNDTAKTTHNIELYGGVESDFQFDNPSGLNQQVGLWAVLWNSSANAPINGAVISFRVTKPLSGATVVLNAITDINGMAYVEFTDTTEISYCRTDAYAVQIQDDYSTTRNLLAYFYVAPFTVRSKNYAATSYSTLPLKYTLVVPRTAEPYTERVNLTIAGVPQIPYVSPVNGTVGLDYHVTASADVVIGDETTGYTRDVGYINTINIYGELCPEYLWTTPAAEIDYLLKTYYANNNVPISNEFTVNVSWWNGSSIFYDPDKSISTNAHGLTMFTVTVPSDAEWGYVEVLYEGQLIASSYLWVYVPSALPETGIALNVWAENATWTDTFDVHAVLRDTATDKPIPETKVCLYLSTGDTKVVTTNEDGEVTTSFTAPVKCEALSIFAVCELTDNFSAVTDESMTFIRSAMPYLDWKLDNNNLTLLLQMKNNQEELVNYRPIILDIDRKAATSGGASTTSALAVYVNDSDGYYNVTQTLPQYGLYAISRGYAWWWVWIDAVTYSPFVVTTTIADTYDPDVKVPITVTITKDGTPVSNASVYIVESAWLANYEFSYISLDKTDENGEATLRLKTPPFTVDGKYVKYQIGVATTNASYVVLQDEFCVVSQPSDAGVNLAVDEAAKDTTVGLNATYMLTLENTGAGWDNYTLRVADRNNASFAALNGENVTFIGDNAYRTGQISAGESVIAWLNVTAETAGTFGVNVTATSESDSGTFDCVNTTTTVHSPTPEVIHSVSLTVDKEAKPTVEGLNATYILTVENTGNVNDAFNLTYSNQDNATVVALNRTQITLNASESGIVLLFVTNETAGTFRVNVTALSQGNTSKADGVNTTTTVGPAQTNPAATGRTEIDALEIADTTVSINTKASVDVIIGKFSANPGTRFSGDIGRYIDVRVNNSAKVTNMTIKLFYTDTELEGKVERDLQMYWWDGADWAVCSDTGVDTTNQNGYSGYIWAFIDDSTRPGLENMKGTPFGAVSDEDTTSLTITFVDPTPANGMVIKENSVNISVTLSEPGSIAYLNWNGVNATMNGAGTKFYLKKTELQNSEYTYKVYAKDLGDNWNMSETRVVSVNVTVRAEETIRSGGGGGGGGGGAYDTDGDGYCDIEEQIMGTDPEDPCDPDVNCTACTGSILPEATAAPSPSPTVKPAPTPVPSTTPAPKPTATPAPSATPKPLLAVSGQYKRFILIAVIALILVIVVVSLFSIYRKLKPEEEEERDIAKSWK